MTDYTDYIPTIARQLEESYWLKAGTTPDEETFTDVPEGTNVRFDFDVSDTTMIDDGAPVSNQPISAIEIVRPSIIDFVANDLANILINGDADSSDPLLKTKDGTEKRGTELRGTELSSVLWASHYNKKEAKTTYTIWVRMKAIEDVD